MSNSSSYSLIDDDHIDDQETINVGNLIIDLETQLEKEKIVNEQVNHNVKLETNAKCSISNSAPSSTSHTATPSSSSTSSLNFTNRSITINKPALNNLTSSKATGKTNQKHHASKKDLSSINLQHPGLINNNGHTVTARTVFKSSADERSELKMKITRETKPGKNEHRIVTSPNQKSPTSSSGGGNSAINVNIADHITNYEDSSSELVFRPKQSSISSTKECGTSTSIGTITEPDCLGPCEPGTSVTLEGIVWQETDGGILVVNVTWRGKTYVGALLDCTRHDWAPPRLCDSPASDIDAKTSKGVRSKRIVTRSNGIGLDEKNLLQTTGKLRNGKGRRIPSTNDPTCSKKQRETTDKPSNETSSAQLEANTLQANMSSTNSEICVPMNIETSSANDSINNNNNNNINNSTIDQQESTHETSNITIDKTGPNSPTLIGCNEPNCSKKYRNMNGLLYHQSHAHSAENESLNSQDDSSASKDTNQEPRPSPPDNCDDIPPPFKNVDPEPRPSSPKNRVDNLPVKHTELDRRPSSGYADVHSGPEVGRKSPSTNQKLHDPVIHGSSSSSRNNTQLIPTSKSSPHVLKPPSNPHHPPLPALADEGMKPSGTSTGPPPAPHQPNCYFNPAFLANTFNPYAMPPYYPRHMYDQPPIAASNAAYFSRFMNSMRAPPPSDSPSRLLSPSMPKNVPFPPFKTDGILPHPQQPHPHQIPTSHPLTNISPMTNSPMPPIPVGPVPPLSTLPGVPPNLRMPSQGDPLMPPNSQPPFLSPAGLNPALGIPGMVNPLGPLMPNLVDEQMAKQFPRRLN